jgi:asparagine synthase (glutamine-hydrolysing)
VVQVSGESRRPPVSTEVLERMTDSMTHRGPDDRGTYCTSGFALGARRLSVVDVEGGHQPFSDESGRVWAAQNGELYNHLDLRRELEPAGHRLRSRCDTEVIPHLYRRHGLSFPERLNGMFAIAVWDEERRRAVLVRDRLGVKPLYWARVGDSVVFGSELKSVLASGMIPTDLDHEAIDAYLQLGFVPGPRTPLASVSKLMPGEMLVVEDGAVRVTRWWEHPRPQVASGRSLREHADHLLELLDDAVRMRLMSDVPLGVMLSGGLDSSLIATLMARRSDRPIETFSVGFTDDAEGNELAAARAMADRLGSVHHELELPMSAGAVDMADLVWHLDEPVADLSALGFNALCRLASEKVTVALSGQGADELLGGYRKHQAASLVGRYRGLPGGLRRAGERLTPLLPRRFDRAAQTLAAEDPVARHLATSSILEDTRRREIARGSLGTVSGTAARDAIRALLGDVEDQPLPAALYLDTQLALVDDMLHYFDRTSMAHSLEVRVPFLDYRVVEYCATIPAEMKVRGLRTKHVLKTAAEGLVPREIIDKPKIGFFRQATTSWFNAQADASIADYLLDPGARYTELIDRGEIERTLAARADGRTPPARELLAVLMLEVWLSTYLPRAVPQPTNTGS